MLGFIKSLLNGASEYPTKTGDFLLAKAKRELEKRLREEGYSKMQAISLVAEQFAQDVSNDGVPRLGMGRSAMKDCRGSLQPSEDGMSKSISSIAKSASL